MRAPTPVAAPTERKRTLERTQSLIALLAAGGLLVLTISAVVSASSQSQVSEALTMIVAWVAVLASALLGRQKSAGTPPYRDLLGPSVAPPVATGPDPSRPPPAPARPTPPSTRPPDPVEVRKNEEPWFEPLLEFAQETLGALQSDRLRLLIAQKLPALLGREDVWVVANLGGHQQVILPHDPDREQPRIFLGDEPRQWATFPLKADGQTVGVLGIEVATRGITAREWRMLTAVSSVLGRAMKTSDAFETMREATLVDPLTGCATRAEGMRRFEAELRRAERSKTPLAVLMIDLDHFKGINDRYGHNTGDAVLSAVGETLLGTLRASDIRSRWGGEEFLVILPESTIESASSAAESLLRRIAGTTVRYGEHIVGVTTSIGITIARPGETDIPRVLGRADAALYQAKSDGRNRVRIALGDHKGAAGPSTGEPAPPPPPPLPDDASPRRESLQVDRRSGMGRRRTDFIADSWAGRSS